MFLVLSLQGFSKELQIQTAWNSLRAWDSNHKLDATWKQSSLKRACRCRAPRATTVSLQDGVLIFFLRARPRGCKYFCLPKRAVVMSNLPKLSWWRLSWKFRSGPFGRSMLGSSFGHWESELWQAGIVDNLRAFQSQHKMKKAHWHRGVGFLQMTTGLDVICGSSMYSFAW